MCHKSAVMHFCYKSYLLISFSSFCGPLWFETKQFEKGQSMPMLERVHCFGWHSRWLGSLSLDLM